VIFKDSELRQFGGEIREIVFPVASRNTDKDQQATTNLSDQSAIHKNLCRFHSLDDRPHTAPKIPNAKVQIKLKIKM